MEETYVDDGTNDLLDLTGLDLGGGGVGAGCRECPY